MQVSSEVEITEYTENIMWGNIPRTILREAHNIGLAVYLQRTGKLCKTTLPFFKNLQSIE